MSEPICCVWCGRTKEDHQAICYPDGSESTEGKLRIRTGSPEAQKTLMDAYRRSGALAAFRAWKATEVTTT